MSEEKEQPSVNKEKYEVINKLLEEEYVLVQVSTGHTGVQIPAHLQKDPVVVLKLSRWFRGGMEVTEERISADLLFGGSYFTCVLPLESIWGVTSTKGENLLWPSSMPPEVVKMIGAQMALAKKPSDEKKEERAADSKHEENEAPSENEPAPPVKKIPHLRRVK